MKSGCCDVAAASGSPPDRGAARGDGSPPGFCAAGRWGSANRTAAFGEASVLLQAEAAGSGDDRSRADHPKRAVGGGDDDDALPPSKALSTPSTPNRRPKRDGRIGVAPADLLVGSARGEPRDGGAEPRGGAGTAGSDSGSTRRGIGAV